MLGRKLRRRLGYDGVDDDIGDNAGEMGGEMSDNQPVHGPPEDFDGDGWIDLWDTDDDNDGHLDTQTTCRSTRGTG